MGMSIDDSNRDRHSGDAETLISNSDRDEDDEWEDACCAPE